MVLKAVLFDLGFTLTKTVSFPEIYRRILARFGVTASLDDIVRAQKETESEFDMSTYDENFLLNVLEKENLPLRKEAVKILRKNESTLERAVEKLFSVSSPFGLKNQILLENIKIIEEADLKEAEDILIAFSKNKFFWNKDLRREASKILGQWNERRN